MAERNTKPKQTIEETVDETVVTEVAEVTEVVDEPVAPVDEPEVLENPVTVGVVSGCRLLNIRLRPDLEAPILCFVRCESELTVDLQESSSDWLRVCSADGVKGYCLARYVYIKP